MYLLDTNICIFAIKKKSQKVIDRIAGNLSEGIFISSLTIAEMEYGISNSMYPEKNRMSLLEFISIFDILNFTEPDAIPYGMLKADLKSSGQLIGPIDMLIASQAISNNLTLVTNNTKEFCRVKDLKLVDWSV
jgi:tRNA(fMet)-specific endonuclease VapC